jgi:hypothetical protein
MFHADSHSITLLSFRTFLHSLLFGFNVLSIFPFYVKYTTLLRNVHFNHFISVFVFDLFHILWCEPVFGFTERK